MPDNEIEHEEDQIIEGGDEFDDAFGKAAGAEDESDTVNSDTDDKDKSETSDDEKVDDSDKDDKTEETDTDKDKKSEEEDKDKKTPDEESEAIKRGKELLEKGEKDKKAQEEQAAKEKEDQEKKEKETTPEAAKPFTADDVKTYAGILKAEDLPDTIEINGEEVDLKSYISDFPEVVPLITMTTQRILKNLVDTGVLVTSNTLNNQVSKINETVEVREFNNIVYRLAPDGMDVDSTIDSQDFKDWLEKEAKPEQKVLFSSGEAKDFALGLKEFDQGIKIKAARDKNKDKDETDRKKKEEHDNLHKSTLKSGGERSGVSESIDSAEQDFDSAFDEAAKGKK